MDATCLKWMQKIVTPVTVVAILIEILAYVHCGVKQLNVHRDIEIYVFH